MGEEGRNYGKGGHVSHGGGGANRYTQTKWPQAMQHRGSKKELDIDT